ncbi:hypothetical protein LC612_39350, partial [Nostoc sp. CHAB 5834]|nr:hypothetical protein [Nostoc sp. CHAB 5834]
FFGVSAGNAQVVTAPDAVTLTGTVVTGTPAPSPIAYQWTQVDGPETVTVSNSNSLVASFVATAPGLYTFELAGTAGGVTKRTVTTVQALAPTAD